MKNLPINTLKKIDLNLVLHNIFKYLFSNYSSEYFINIDKHLLIFL